MKKIAKFINSAVAENLWLHMNWVVPSELVKVGICFLNKASIEISLQKMLYLVFKVIFLGDLFKA